MNGQNGDNRRQNEIRSGRPQPPRRPARPLTEEERRQMLRRDGIGNQSSRSTPPAAPRAPRPERSAPAKKKPPLLSARNLKLAAILIGVLIIALIVFGIKSCSKKETSAYEPDSKNSVKLATEKAETDKPEEKAPVFAEYTDDSIPLEIDSDYGILINLADNKVIASKKGDEKIYPASMTKIMTLITAYENASDLDEKFTFTAEMLDPLYAENASQAGFVAGESVSVRDMLFGCILPSGADATAGLARCIAGSEEEFVELMNKKAAELGLKNTHFVTVSGLHDKDHYSTCHEMAIILRYAINEPYMREVLSTYKYTTAPTPEHPEGIELTSTLKQRMAGDEAEGIFVQGGKTGFTNEALNCLATFAAHCTEEMAPDVKPEYVLVTAYASGEYTPIFDAINVYKKYCSN